MGQGLFFSFPGWVSRQLLVKEQIATAWPANSCVNIFSLTEIVIAGSKEQG